MTKNQDRPPKTPSNAPYGPYRFNWFNWLWVSLLLIVTLLLHQSAKPKEIGWTALQEDLLDRNFISQIVVVNKEVAEIYLNEEAQKEPEFKEVVKGPISRNRGPHFFMTLGSLEHFEKQMQQYQEENPEGNPIDIRYKNKMSWVNILSWLLPLGMFLFLWFYVFRSFSSTRGGNPFTQFGKSTAKLREKDTLSTITFKDVAGLGVAKSEVMQVVDFLKHPKEYTKLGAKIPKGVLLVGPPGTGKTLMAKAVAGEAAVPFFSISGSEFVEMFVGVGASRVRDLFKRAKERAPSIVFIDEIDAVGRSRGKINAFQANDERESTLNQLLTELDGFGDNPGVIVLAATNRPDVLDKALLRPGRFDRHIYLELPNQSERTDIFKVHLRPLKLSKDVDVSLLAKLSPGFSGADIANICNEAALIAARQKKKAVGQKDFMEARDRIIGGLERKGKIISEKERDIVAHHEAGHAVASWYLEHVDSLVKVSIIPRGRSLGAAWYLPEERQIVTRSQFIDQICASLGGRAAEEIIFGEASSGALDDLEKVTKQAYTMVAYYGLDDKLGPISYYDSTGSLEQSMVRPYSEDMAKTIDAEVGQLVRTAYQRVKNLLTVHLEELKQLAQLLLTHEVVEQDELIKLLGDRKEMSLRKHHDPVQR